MERRIRKEKVSLFIDGLFYKYGDKRTYPLISIYYLD